MSFDWKIRISDIMALIGTAVAVVYTVASVQFTTGKLSEAISGLTNAVVKLDSKIETAREDVHKLKERLVVIEHIQGNKSGR